MNRKLKTKLGLISPLGQSTTRNRVEDEQRIQKDNHDRSATQREFQIGDSIFVKNFSTGPKWLCGTILSQSGPVSYVVQLSDGGICRRHVDHIRSRLVDTCEQQPNSPPIDIPIYPSIISGTAETQDSSEKTTADHAPLENTQGITEPATASEVLGKTPLQLIAPTKATPTPTADYNVNRPVRIKTAPSYLKDYVHFVESYFFG
jgi:hypothetical protein